MSVSFRVYFVRHGDGMRTGYLMNTGWSPELVAYGTSEEDVHDQLTVQILTGDDVVSPTAGYLTEEAFHTRRIDVPIHPLSAVGKRYVIGARTIPLRITYVWSRMKSGAYRVMLPRFGWWFILESLDMAPRVVRNAIGSALLGDAPAWIFDFRQQGEEYVRVWRPSMLSAARARWARRPAREVEQGGPTLRRVADELVGRARRGKLRRMVGVQPELEAVALPAALEGTPRSIVVVGDPGVGKTALVHGLAHRLVRHARQTGDLVPRIWSTTADRIIAGMAYLGQWEQRCLRLVEELAWEGDYLYIGALTELLQERGGHTSIASLLGDPLARGEISLIAECTPSELERCQRRAPSLLSQLRVIRLEERSAEAAVGLMASYLARYGRGLTVHGEGLRVLARHLSSFERDRRFPGKAIRMLDWLIQQHPEGAARQLFPREVTEAFARRTGIGVELLDDGVKLGAADVTTRLQRRIIGQDGACATVARIVSRFKAGLQDTERPLGSLLFVGPTGVGKTELAKALARTLFSDERRLVRCDMSEFMLPGSSARLLRADPGVRSLARRVSEQPLSVVLLDEIEKAHPEVFDLLLGLLGEGRLTDSRGRLVDFRMCLIVMTSNLGVRASEPLGFASAADSAADLVNAVRGHFRPELFNRIDEVVPFSQLEPTHLERIVELMLDEVARRIGLRRRRIELTVDRAARALLARLGWDPKRGARPLQRVIEERVTTPLAVMLSADPEASDFTLRVRAGSKASAPTAARPELVVAERR